MVERGGSLEGTVNVPLAMAEAKARIIPRSFVIGGGERERREEERGE